MSSPAPIDGLVGPFPAEVTPARPGLYRVVDPFWSGEMYSLWDGVEWKVTRINPRDAERVNAKSVRMYEGSFWYGRPAP